MYNPRFEKDVFKRDVRNNVKTLFRKEVEEATPQQLFQAVSYACLLYTSPSPRDTERSRMPSSA